MSSPVKPWPGPRYFVWVTPAGNEQLCEFRAFCVCPPETVEKARDVLARWKLVAWQAGRYERYYVLEGDSWTPPLVVIPALADPEICSYISERMAKVAYDVQKLEKVRKSPEKKKYTYLLPHYSPLSSQ